MVFFKKILILFVIFLAGCSTLKKLEKKQKKVNKLEFEIMELKKELGLPLDSEIIKLDTFITERRSVKFDTIKLKCDSNNNVVYKESNKPLEQSEVVTKTEYITKDKIINKIVEKVKKEIIYKDKDFQKKHLILMAFGLVAIIILLGYGFAKISQILIKIIKP